jgi:hypothetical protein
MNPQTGQKGFSQNQYQVSFDTTEAFLRIAGLWTIFFIQNSENWKTGCFRNWISFHPQVKGERHILSCVP